MKETGDTLESALNKRTVIKRNLTLLRVNQSGKAPGIDRRGEEWANMYGIPIKPFFAKWRDLKHRDRVVKINAQGQKYDARAGYRRNEKMAKYADALIAVWDGKSKGTRDMIALGKKHLKPENVYVYRTDQPPEILETPRAIKIVKRYSL